MTLMEKLVRVDCFNEVFDWRVEDESLDHFIGERVALARLFRLAFTFWFNLRFCWCLFFTLQ